MSSEPPMPDDPPAQPAPQPRKHLVYFGDPMCSWCYGFAPTLKALADHFGDRLPIGLVMGGLRPGTTRSMTLQERDEIRNHWNHVQDASAQVFDYAFFDRGRFVYNTEPACRAVIVFRRANPDAALDYFASLQRAFYADNRDITKPEVLADIAAGHGRNAAQFAAELQDPIAREETMRDFLQAQDAGVTGFPTVIAGSITGGYAMLAHGFRPIDGMIEGLEAWLAEDVAQRQRTSHKPNPRKFE